MCFAQRLEAWVYITGIVQDSIQIIEIFSVLYKKIIYATVHICKFLKRLASRCSGSAVEIRQHFSPLHKFELHALYSIAGGSF